MTKFGKIAVKSCNPAAKARPLFDKHDIVTGFGAFDGRRNSGDTAADDDNCLAFQSPVAHFGHAFLSFFKL